MQSGMPFFHLAFPVLNLEATRQFFVENLGCRTGRESERWIDFDFHGHQITAHRVEAMPPVPTNHVDGKQVPVAHFGLLLDRPEWDALVRRLRDRGVGFLIEPYLRFEGQPGEQGTFFILDPSGNGLEFKTFTRAEELFTPG